MARLLLILPSATYRAPDFIAAAQALGVAVTVASDRAAAMSRAMGERTLTIRTSDPQAAAEAIVARAHDTPFAAIVGVDDQGVMAAALAAERLGLAHNPPHAVARIAAHGGHAELVAIEGAIAYLRLGGGCVGCGMATVTLSQGIEVAITDAVAEIEAIVDVTDHASGRNPYFEPAKK